ncbi:hypothetical protein [Abiotrophia defectiva]|uniref:hypothetical protein n=1 Tax=Abiotrophia defectiva TaxID=46125 RepID=UPI00205D7FA9|nr:hypothetical protein [Abiotrophia defectiva]DAS51167.1 MAG TPA: hypothetical protein [Caudoviricetes sp.]
MDTQVSKILDLLTKGMEGVPDIASQAFQIMVRGKFVNGMAKIVLAVILLMIVVGAYIVIWRKMKEDKEPDWIMVLAVMILPITAGLFYLYEGINSAMAPEYDAVMTLLRMVK